MATTTKRATKRVTKRATKSATAKRSATRKSPARKTTGGKQSAKKALETKSDDPEQK